MTTATPPVSRAMLDGSGTPVGGGGGVVFPVTVMLPVSGLAIVSIAPAPSARIRGVNANDSNDVPDPTAV